MSLLQYWKMLFYLNNFNEFLERIFILTGISVLLFFAFYSFFLFKTKFKSADGLWVVEYRQALISFIASVYIWGLFSILFGTLLWIGLFLCLRFYGFAFCAKRFKKNTDEYNENSYELRDMYNSKNFKWAFLKPIECKIIDCTYRYSFNSYANSLVIVIIFCGFGLASPIDHSVSFVIYALEFFIVATAVYYFLGKGIYYVALFSPTSLTYLCSGLSYVPVVAFGAVYYFVSIIIMITTSIGWKCW